MAQPTGSDMFVTRPLTNISIAYMQDQQDFIADRVFPPIPVDKQYSMYYKYDKGDWFRTGAQRRAPRTESAGGGWNVSTDQYRAEVNAFHVDIADQDRANQDTPVFNLDRDATIFVTRDLLLRREKDFLTKYFGVGLWSQADQTGVAAGPAANQFLQWNLSASTPIEDIEAQRIKMGKLTGFRPNVIVTGPEVHAAWKNHPEIMDRIKYTERGIITDELMASLFEVDNLYTPMAIENSAEEGAADNFNFLYGKSMLFAYRAPNPGLMQPSAGYVFEWTGYLGAEARGVRMKKFRMEHLEADRAEGESAYDFKLVSPDLAVFFANAVA